MDRATLKKRLAHRKGAAMEMAIMVTVVTFSLSVLILTTSVLQHSRQRRAKESMAQSIVLEQIGEDFCADAYTRNRDWIEKYPDYEIGIDGYHMFVTEKDSDRVLLRVELTLQDDRFTISRWEKK